MTTASNPSPLLRLRTELWDHIFSYTLPNDKVIERANLTSNMRDKYGDSYLQAADKHRLEYFYTITDGELDDEPPLRHDEAKSSFSLLQANVQLWEKSSHYIYDRTSKITISGLMVSFVKLLYRKVTHMPMFPFSKAKLVHIEIANPACPDLHKETLFENLLDLCYYLDFETGLRLRIDLFENATNVSGLLSLDTPTDVRIADFGKLLEPFKLLRAVEEVQSIFHRA